MFVVNLDGNVISSTEIGQIGRNVSGEAYFTKTIENGTWTSELRCPQGLRKSGIFEIGALLLSNLNREPIGIIVNRYSSDYMGKVTYNERSDGSKKVKRPEALGETGELYIVNRDKLMVTGSRFIKDAVFKQVVDTVGVQVANENKIGMVGIYSGYRGKSVLGASRYFEKSGWILLAEKDAVEAFAPLVFLRNSTAILGIVGIIVIVAVSIVLSRGITRPIKKLARYSQNIAKGELAEQITVASKDEVGSLARSFEKMRLNLTELIGKNNEAREDWESTFNAVTDIIIIYDKDYKLIRCNNVLLNKLNIKSEEIVGKQCNEVFNQNYSKYSHICPVIETNKSLKSVTREVEVPNMGGFYNIKTFPRFNLEDDFIGIVQVMRDITERKKAEEVITKLSSAIEQSPATVTITDTEGNIEYVNPKFTQLTGYTPEEVIGCNPSILKSGEKTAEEYRELWKTIKSGGTWQGEFHNKKKNGELYWESASISSITNKEGEITHFLAVKEDITARKQAEMELTNTNKILLRKNRELSIINDVGDIFPHSLGFERTLDNVLNKILEIFEVEVSGIYMIDEQSGQLRLMDCKGFSKRATEILEKYAIGDRFYNSVAKTHEAVIIENIKSDKYLSSVIKGKDGILSIAVTPLISQEKVIGTLFLLTMKHHHFAEEDIQFLTVFGSQIGIAIDNCMLFNKIRRNKEEWEDTFNTISDSICIVDKDFRIIRANNGTTNLVDMEMDNITGKYSYEIFYGTGIPVDECPVVNCVESKKVQYAEIYSINLNRLLFITAFPRFDEKGRIINVVQVVRDVTEQRAFEDQLRTSYKMASLGRLTAGVFHEVLNPLNIISSHIQLLLIEAEKGSKAEEDLKSIQEEIARIVKISDSLLRFSRKENSKAEETEINDILERVISIVEPELKLRSIKIIRKFDVNLPHVTANSGELRQVFLNLITNARDAMPDGGNIIVETQSLKKEERPFTRIQFIDTGNGIEEEVIENIFEPFFTTKEEGKGTGLGLSESYHIIENHGGILSVKSEIGKGTTFIIDLPVMT